MRYSAIDGGARTWTIGRFKVRLEWGVDAKGEVEVDQVEESGDANPPTKGSTNDGRSEGVAEPFTIIGFRGSRQ